MSLPRPEADPHIGRTLGGQYRIEALLGHGGMGRVYRGLQLSVKRQVAIKLIAGQAPHPPEWLRRFRREAEATAQLSHPNSVRLFDFGVTESQELYIVMELLDGVDLARHLLERGPLPLTTALSITRQVLLALCEAHAVGITHRDIKPDNIFLANVRGAEVVAKVMDFGIAGLAPVHSSRKLTGTGVVIGTPAYMSPEQAQGLSVSGKSDVYSVGVVLFEMLTGRPVFESHTALTLLLAHVARAPKRLHEAGVQLPQQTQLQALMDRLLAKDPALRPSATEALAEVTALAVRQGVASATGTMRVAPTAMQSAARSRGSGATRATTPGAHGARDEDFRAVVTAAGATRARLQPAVFALGAALVVASAIALAVRWVPTLVQAARPEAAPTTPAQTLHTVMIRSTPTGASVFMGGDKRGTTPYALQLRDDAEISVAADGYVRQLVRVPHDAASPVTVTLAAESSEPESGDPVSHRVTRAAGAGPGEPGSHADPAPHAPHVPITQPVPSTPEQARPSATAPPPRANTPVEARPTPSEKRDSADEEVEAHAPIFFSFRRASSADQRSSEDESDPRLHESRPLPAAAEVETSRSASTRVEPLREDELSDLALDDAEQQRVADHHGLRVIGRALAKAVGRLLIPYPNRTRREALAEMPLAYPSFREARRAYKHNEVDGKGFQEAVWQLRERRRQKIELQRDRYARGVLTRSQYEARLDGIWAEFWGR